MLSSELIDLIKRGETDTVEFKESFNRETIEAIGSFSNTKGGLVIIGVSNKGEIYGIETGKETLPNWVNQIAQSTEPRIIPFIEEFKLEEKRIVLIHVKEYPIKPVSVKGRCFRRVGSSNRIMTPQEIGQMLLYTTEMSWDKLPAGDQDLDSIDVEEVGKYIKKANESGKRRIDEDEDYKLILDKLKLIKDGRPTWGAILLFGKEVNGLLSQAVIHCGRFKKETIVIDDRMITGTIIEQVNEAMDFIRKNINVKFVMTGKPEREEVWEYPLEALREAVINAVCHRDYAIPSNIDIRIYDDRLIVWSPGSLPKGITLEDLYKPHASVLRNKAIGGVFYDIGWIEQWGSGIDKMRNACKEAGLPEPSFKETQGFVVIFRKDMYSTEYLNEIGLKERQIKAVLYVKQTGKITNKIYRNITGLSDEGVRKDVKDLIEKRIFAPEGKGRNAHYVLR